MLHFQHLSYLLLEIMPQTKKSSEILHKFLHKLVCYVLHIIPFQLIILLLISTADKEKGMHLIFLFLCRCTHYETFIEEKLISSVILHVQLKCKESFPHGNFTDSKHSRAQQNQQYIFTVNLLIWGCNLLMQNCYFMGRSAELILFLFIEISVPSYKGH